MAVIPVALLSPLQSCLQAESLRDASLESLLAFLETERKTTARHVPLDLPRLTAQTLAYHPRVASSEGARARRTEGRHLNPSFQRSPSVRPVARVLRWYLALRDEREDKRVFSGAANAAKGRYLLRSNGLMSLSGIRLCALVIRRLDFAAFDVRFEKGRPRAVSALVAQRASLSRRE